MPGREEGDATVSNKTTARIVGVLFLAATATYLSGTLLIDSIVNAPDYLIHVYPNRTQVTIGALLQFIDVACVVGICVLLFPILRKHSEPVALGYVVARIFDGAGVVVRGFAALSLIALSQQYVQAGAPDASYFQELGTLLVAQYDLAFQIAMIALGLGSIPFCYLLYRSRLIPRSLAVLGLIAYAALLSSALLEVFGYSTGVIFLYLPGAFLEIILPIWLIVKGFNPSALTSESANSK
jgi:Domain of unknown function (DUF4386)